MSLLPRPKDMDAVSYSPAPSIVTTVASSKGEQKKADAACAV